MKTKQVLIILFSIRCLLLSAADVVADYQVVPLPQSISLTSKAPFVLTENTVITYPKGNIQMKNNAQFLSSYIKDNTGLTLSTVTKKTKHVIALTLNNKVKEKEGYSIVVKSDGIVISGKTPQGVFYGIQTLRKSLPVGDSINSISMPTVVIRDAPRFGYRGMMLDCCRHFFPVKFVKEYIDLIAMHNMNVFHWHLSDDQGWRIEIKKYPKLTEIGSKRPNSMIGRNSGVYDDVPCSGFYTQDEAREIVKNAAERYITVIPEIDMPGHMLSALAAYPDMGCTGGPYEVARSWGIFPDVLCLGNEKTYQFCEDVFSELMTVFPSKYIHIGGDESPVVRWEKCAKCQKLAKEQNLSFDKLQGYFTNRIEKFIDSHNHCIIGWDELLGGNINQSATIMSWRGVEPGIRAAQLGHDVIMSPASHMYFDYYQTKDTYGEPLLIGGCSTVKNVYDYNPVPDSLDAKAAGHILGVQANLWAEYINCPSLVEYQVLPRMAALAEVQWTVYCTE